MVAGEHKYQDRAWRIFTAIEKNCRVDDHGGANGAYGAYPDVSVAGRKPNDKMESFFISESLKYLSLTFETKSQATKEFFKTYVFNTEAH